MLQGTLDNDVPVEQLLNMAAELGRFSRTDCD
jgi:hypothetical protein